MAKSLTLSKTAVSTEEDWDNMMATSENRLICKFFFLCSQTSLYFLLHAILTRANHCSSGLPSGLVWTLRCFRSYIDPIFHGMLCISAHHFHFRFTGLIPTKDDVANTDMI